MKKIEAFVREEKLDAVLNGLEQAGYPGVSISEIRGLGKQRGAENDWHGQYKNRSFHTKIRLEIVAHDADVNRLIQAIVENARTQDFGDGKIFVSDILEAVRIRTNQRGSVALD